MWKFVVVKTKGNCAKIVRRCGSLEEAMRSGAQYFEAMPEKEGIVSVEAAETVMRPGWRKIYHVWYR